jgi:uncharacterized RDD family membrane protein YckC
MQDFDVIETPENVELEQRLAGMGSRFIAGLVDTLIILGTIVLVVLLLIISGLVLIDLGDAVMNPGALVLTALIIFVFLVYWGYFVFFEMRTNGQSPGKKRMKIRVVKEGGGAIGFTDIAIRNLLRVVDVLPMGYAVGGVCMFVTRKTQRLGDLAAGTVVLSEQKSDYSAMADKSGKKDWETDVTARHLRATELKPQEYQVLMNYRLRRSELSLEARERILPKLLAPIVQRMNVSLPEPSMAGMEKFLDDLFLKTLNEGQSELKKDQP